VIPVDFDYMTAATVGEAVDALDRFQGQVLAGGQTLIPRLKARLEKPKMLVDIRSLAGLSDIEITSETVTIGALVRQRQIEDSEELARALPIMRETAGVVADPAVRSQGTLVGSLAAADPGGDWHAVALALNGVVKATGPETKRGIPVSDLFLDPFTTSLEQYELITHVELEIPPRRAGTAYVKLRHPASGFALVGVAAVVRLDDSGRCAGCRIAVTGAGPRASRARVTEALLEGREPHASVVAGAARHAADHLDFSADIHAGKAYRGELVKVYARRALSLAVQRAQTSVA
jgi:aerobic carbon-monoxide dehydrogenase medium subunit